MSSTSREKSTSPSGSGKKASTSSKIWGWLWKEEDSKTKANVELQSSSNSTSAAQTSSAEVTPPVKKNAKRESTNDSHKSSSSESNIAKAKQVIHEIEAIIEKELSMMTDEGFIMKENTPTTKARKRPGPKLIKPLNKKKNKMVIGEMEFDPIRNIWVGNEKDLSVFQRNQPALITNMSKNQVQVIGDMVFDPVELKWKGNEKDLSKFKSSNRPALISQLNPVNEVIEKNGMVFDPDAMTWKGNDDEVDIFDGITTEDEKNGFKVGQEFSLSADVRAMFMECQKKHDTQMSGWISKESDRVARSHLNSIRSMSIIRIINQAKHGGPLIRNSPVLIKASPSGSTSSAANPTSMVNNQGTTIRLKSPAVSSEDEDWGDVEFTPNMKLKSLISPPSVEEIETLEDFSEEVEKDKESKNVVRVVQTPSLSSPSLSKYQDDEGEDDMDFDEPVVSPKKEQVTPLQVTKPKHTSSTKDMARLSLSSDDDRIDEEEDNNEWEGVEVPQGSNLFLASGTTNEDEAFWDSGSERSRSNSLSSRNSFDQNAEVVEEDWPDVEIPTNGKLATRLQNVPRTTHLNMKMTSSTGGNRSEDELSGLELPSNGLFNRRIGTGVSEGEDSEKEALNDEDWGDVDVPDDFASKLKTTPRKALEDSMLKSNLFG